MSSPYTTPAYSVRTSGTAERITRDANRSPITHHRPSTRSALARSYQAETRAARRQEVREAAVYQPIGRWAALVKAWTVPAPLLHQCRRSRRPDTRATPPCEPLRVVIRFSPCDMDALEELRKDALDSQVPLSTALRRAYAFGHQVKATALVEWIGNELNGYDLDTWEHRA